MATCKGYTTPYNESPFPGALPAKINHNNIDTLQYEAVGDET